MIRTSSCDTLRDLYLRSCEWRAAEPFFVDERERIGGTQALDRSLRMAQGYAELGAGRGDVVAFLCRSSARHAVSWFGGPLAGRVVCNLHARETPERLGETIAWLEAKILVHDADLADLAKSAVTRTRTSCARVSLGERGTAAATYDALVSGTERLTIAGESPAPGDLAAIILSSGSTGRPKGVMHTQHTLLETAKGGQLAFGPITPNDAVLLLMQPSFAAWVVIVVPFAGGKGKVCFGSQFTPSSFLSLLERERITMAPLVPTMWRRVFDEDLSRYDLSALRLATISGEPPAASDIERLTRSVCPGVASLYLSSEGLTASAVLAFTPDLLKPGKAASSGRPALGVDVRIIDPAGGFDDEVPRGESGEIAISGPSLAIGYWKNPELTRLRFRDRWWRSGDLGRLDEDGFLWVLGRLDNIINSGGIKVSGEEVERALLSHPAVAQCAVIGRPDPGFGQRIEAYLVCRGTPPGAEALQAHCREECGLASFKVPKMFHFVNELPTGPTGKIYRRALRGEDQR